MPEPCIGFLEFANIAKGIEATDALLKKASVEIVFSHPISSGKYLTMFSGDVESVRSSWSEGREIGKDALVGSFFIPNLHPAICAAIQASPSFNELNALGILETTTCSSCIEAADIALKTGDVQLLRLHLGQGIAGKAYFIIDGEVGEIESALLPAIGLARKQESLVEKVIIARATPELLDAIT